MARTAITAIVFFLLISTNAAWAQQAAFKSFNKYAGLVKGVDFFASNKQLIEPYQPPAAQAIERLQTLLGENLPKGSIFVISTLEQKDSYYEPMIMKLGYAWVLSVESPDLRIKEAEKEAEQRLAEIKAQMGDDIPPEFLERMQGMQSRMRGGNYNNNNRMVQDIARRIAYAVIQTSFAKNLKYRSSRLNDMGKSPLPDWLDIGIGVYVTGNDPNRAYLLQNMDKTFSIEDIVTMSRPFVASTFLQGDSAGGGRGFGSRGGGRGGEGFPSGGFGGMSGGNFPQGGMGQGGGPPGGFGGMSGGGFPSGGFGGMRGGDFPSGGMGDNGGGQNFPRGEGQRRGGTQRTIPKDEQDQMLFDGQSSTFFAFLMQKVGVGKIKELIRAVQKGTEGRDFIARPDMLGNDYGKIEEEWIEWLESQEPASALSRSGTRQENETD